MILSSVIIGYVLFIGDPHLAYSMIDEKPCYESDNRSFEYGNRDTILTGTIIEATKYGPPNYGEKPETDKKLTYYYLELESPISVKGDPRSDLNQDTFTNVKLIQLLAYRLKGRIILV